MQYIVETDKLTKQFKGKTLIREISIKVKQGEIYGLLGPNGAGKTTLMKMFVNLIKPSIGQLTIFGKRIQKHDYAYLRAIGSIIETPVFHEKLTAYKNLELYAEYLSFYQSGRIEEVLEIVGLTHAMHDAVAQFSLGMKQRLGIARAILAKPQLLILDEPINGLDPAGIREIREILQRLKKVEGTTIIISSHILSELEQLVDTVAIITKGQLVEELSMEAIQAKSVQYFVLKTNNVEKASAYLVSELALENIKVENAHQINIYDDKLSYQELLKAISQSDIDIEAFEKVQGNLEDYFFSQTEEGDLHV